MVIDLVVLAEDAASYSAHIGSELQPRYRVRSLYGVEKHQKLVESIVTNVMQSMPILDEFLHRRLQPYVYRLFYFAAVTTACFAPAPLFLLANPRMALAIMRGKLWVKKP